MAFGIIIRFPEGVGQDAYDAVSAQLDVAGNPPDGLVFHCAGELDGTFQVFDVWEQGEQYDRFVEERLIPAQKAVMGEEAFAQMPTADRVRTEVHNYVVP